MSHLFHQPCSCGEAKSHVVARRMTSDDVPIALWDNGALTWGSLGHFVKNSSHPRTAEHARVALRAGRLVLGDVCLYDAKEVPTLVSAARWAAARDGLPGTMRARYRKLTEPRGLVPRWTVEERNARGEVVSRYWILPRLLDPTLAVWHERGVYAVMRRTSGSLSTLFRADRQSQAFAPTGFEFKTQRELLRALPSLVSRPVKESC